jgi:thiol-disulfide isomerase/thioredoxin
MLKQLKVILVMLLLFSVANARASVDFSMSGIDGKEYRLSDFKGKWVLVNFWATWCPPCLEEMPELEIFHSRHKDSNAVVIGVNYETEIC